MGEKLIKYYKYVGDTKGLSGKTALARMTMIPSIIAATEPDSPENLDRFRKAVAEITGKPAPTV